MKKWQLWIAVIGLGVGACYLGYELWKAIAANQELAKDNNIQRNQKENAIQQIEIEKQQKNAAIEKKAELETKVAQLESELDKSKKA